MIGYEAYLNADKERAMHEGGLHFDEASKPHKTLNRITQRLEQLGVPYVVVGAMALYYYGYRRFTEDVDLLVTEEGLKRIHEGLEGLGYAPVFKGSKALRDTEYGVKIDFLVTGGFPGDGKPKPVQFPDPASCSFEMKGKQFIELSKLIELKLASGMGPGRRKDLGDVQEAIRYLKLPRELGEKLDAFVMETYFELWDELRSLPLEEREPAPDRL